MSLSYTLSHLFIPHFSNNHRPKILHVESLVALSAIVLISQLFVGVLSTSFGPLPAVLGFSANISAADVVTQTNAQRTALGLSALTLNAQLTTAAQAKAEHMCANQYWAHISPSGVVPWEFIRTSGYSYSVAGENLARDFSQTSDMVAAWMASPTHKANIVNPKYKDIGIAVKDCKLLGHDTALVVQMFGSPFVRTVSVASPETKVEGEQTAPEEVPTVQPEQQVAGQQSEPQLIADTQPALTLPVQEASSRLSVFTPLEVIKSILISILLTLLFALAVDLWLFHKRNTVRIAGKNLAHILFLSGILIVIICIKAGVTL